MSVPSSSRDASVSGINISLFPPLPFFSPPSDLEYIDGKVVRRETDSRMLSSFFLSHRGN